MTATVTPAATRMAQIQARFTPTVRSGTAASSTTSSSSSGAAIELSRFDAVLSSVLGASDTTETGSIDLSSLASALSSMQSRPSALRASTASTASTLRTGTTAGAGGEDAVAAAKQYLGVDYLWGGTDPSKGLDCSGLVQRAYRDLGVELPRVSYDQAKAGTKVDDISQAKPGDLVAFGSPVDHIGIYVGDGKMIHAPRTGDVVRIGEIRRPIAAIRRVLPESSSDSATTTSMATAGTGTTIPGSTAFADLFEASGARHGVNPRLLAAVAKAESNFDPTARSSAGAVGLMQFMPATARGLGIDPTDPAQAVDGAARYLKAQLDRFGSTELALAAYNAGPGAVQRAGGVPPYAETRNYVTKVMGLLGGQSATAPSQSTPPSRQNGVPA